MTAIKNLYLRMQKKSTRNKTQAVTGNNPDWLFKELGVYSDDPNIDKKINDELIKYLEQLGSKKTEIKLR